jgi:hypothetical protein
MPIRSNLITQDLTATSKHGAFLINVKYLAIIVGIFWLVAGLGITIYIFLNF